MRDDNRQTNNLIGSNEVNTDQFIQQNFAELIIRGKKEVVRIASFLQYKKVKRSYFHPHLDTTYVAAKIVCIKEVKMIGAGVIVLTDDKGATREYPLAEFDVRYRSDRQAVEFYGPKVSIVFERLLPDEDC